MNDLSIGGVLAGGADAGAREKATATQSAGSGRPRLLDLFSGAGGAGMGYYRAGFEVVGVDIERQPRYPFEFICADALELLGAGLRTGMICGVWRLADFDAIHASPPCQRYSTMGQRFAATQAEHPDLIAPVRDLLIASGLPYVIENVMGARREMRNPMRICGASLGLGVGRHRLFECSFPTMSLECACDGSQLPVYGKLDGRRLWTRVDGSELRSARTLAQAQQAMGIEWMEWAELTQAIPPTYCERIGHYLMAAVQSERQAA